MKALVTGGAGFLASHLIRKLLARGDEVVALDDMSTGNLANIEEIVDRISFVKGDIRDEKTVTVAAEGVDVIIHLASQVSHIRSQMNPRLDLEVNALGTLNILEAARPRRTPVVYACSRSIYGKQWGLGRYRCPKCGEEEVFLGEDRLKACPVCVEGDMTYLGISEEAPNQPLDAYGITKLAAEKYCMLYGYHHGVPVVSLRMANLFGARQVITSEYQFIACVAWRVMSREPFTFYGDGSQSRDFLYAGDAAGAYIRFADFLQDKRDSGFYDAYNLPGKDFVTWKRAMEIAEMATEGKAVVEWIPHTPLRAKLENPHSRLDGSKIKQAIGWEPRVGLAEGFMEMKRFYFKDENWKRYVQEDSTK